MKKALVTGSSRGIGRSIAYRLAKDGYYIIINCARSVNKAEELLSEVRAFGGDGEIIVADLTKTEETKKLAEKVTDVDVIVLNASLQYRNPWQKITVEECYEQLNCNFVSSMILIQAVADHMKEQKWGRIITVGSVQEAKPHPDMLVYAASKAAQTNMSHSLALQLAPFNVTVNNVAPGVIYTDRNKAALSDKEYAAKVSASIPMGFYGMPDDLAGIVSLLCSEDGRYITGQSIYVDGGKGIQ